MVNPRISSEIVPEIRDDAAAGVAGISQNGWRLHSSRVVAAKHPIGLNRCALLR